jgi:hypothetical protein
MQTKRPYVVELCAGRAKHVIGVRVVERANQLWFVESYV